MRHKQIFAWSLLALFVAGFFVPIIGLITGPMLGLWFIGTQRLRRGLLWMFLINLVFTIPAALQPLISAHVLNASALINLYDVTLQPSLFSLVPFFFHRWIAPRLPRALFPLPFAVASILMVAGRSCFGIASVSLSALCVVCLRAWLAAVVVQGWNLEWDWLRLRSSLFTSIVVAAGIGLMDAGFGSHLLQPSALHIISVATFATLAAAVLWSLYRPETCVAWSTRTDAIARLRSPLDGAPLHCETLRGSEFLVSESGAAFPIRNGRPNFLAEGDLTGDNLKYNHTYETIGGFYDDTQRVFCALSAVDLKGYFRGYMAKLEVKADDAVLETSVGTGLNLQYLPKNVRITGLDLSDEMLHNCQANVRRWNLQADLMRGNAERLPFADAAFDVVFHVGGINFFNDRAAAIREMIRVAKPGSKILIVDETEKHVKEVYENQPGSRWRNRKEPVKPPVDLVPVEMQDVQLETMRNGNIYALTFRKPALVAATV